MLSPPTLIGVTDGKVEAGDCVPSIIEAVSPGAALREVAVMRVRVVRRLTNLSPDFEWLIMLSRSFVGG
jgi:hypothetical protein